jgi:hypothetical protein
MQESEKKRMTIHDLRQEVEEWRKQKPENESLLTFIRNPAGVAASLIFFILLFSTVTLVPLIELFKLLILRPALTIFHTTVVILAAVFLRITARPLIRTGIKAIKNKNKRGYRLIYKGFPRLLRFFVSCFGPSLKYYLKIDTKDVRSIGKFQEWIDDTVGVEGIWIESDIHRAVRRETWCPFVGREIPCSSESETPDASAFCSDFMAGWVNDFLAYCNPEFELAPVRYMIPKGDDFCEFVWRRKTTPNGGPGQ